MQNYFQTTKESLKKLSAQRAVQALFILLVTVCVCLGIFQAGMSVGFHKAMFERNSDRHYVENFGPSRFMNAHGTVGKIISVSLPSIVVSDRGNTEKSVIIASTTDVREQQNEIAPSSLVPGMFVVVIGDPTDQGQITAKLIRVLPQPPAAN